MVSLCNVTAVKFQCGVVTCPHSVPVSPLLALVHPRVEAALELHSDRTVEAELGLGGDGTDVLRVESVAVTPVVKGHS